MELHWETQLGARQEFNDQENGKFAAGCWHSLIPTLPVTLSGVKAEKLYRSESPSPKADR